MTMAVAALAACSKNEPAPGIEGQQQQLNILTSVKTRSVVTGTAMPANSEIGVHLIQDAAGTPKVYVGQNYTAGGANLQTGENVLFDNTANASNWVSKASSGGAAAFLMIGTEEGTVYGYYPYTTTVTGVGELATIPATVLTAGNIDLSTAANGSKNYDATEIDYLYYKPAGARATVKSTSSTTAPLDMAHAMASVSFRMYVSADAPTVNNGDDKYYLMGYTIKNKSGKTLFTAANTDVTMKLADGTITTTTTGGEIVRTLNTTNGYALTRVTGSSANDTEKGNMVWFGNLTFPIASIAHSTVNGVDCSDDIEIVFSIKKGSSDTAANYTAPLVVTTGETDATMNSDKWLAGKNYQYTIKVNAYLSLGIEQVTVTDWVDVVGGEIEIK